MNTQYFSGPKYHSNIKNDLQFSALTNDDYYKDGVAVLLLFYCNHLLQDHYYQLKKPL